MKLIVSSDHRVGVLDALRGTTALLVLASHADLLGGATPDRTLVNLSGFFIHSMALSVDLFFALSGYLVAGPFIRALVEGTPLPELRDYALRRGSRILPAYWVALAAVLVVARPAGLHIWQLPVHFLLLQSLVPGESQLIFFVAWTLGLEMVFYLLLPVVATMLRRLVTGPVPVRALAAILTGYVIIVALATPLLDHLAATGGLRSPVGVVTGVSEGLLLFVPGMLVYLAELHHKTGKAPWRIYRLAGDRPFVVLTAAVVTALLARAIWFVAAPEIALRALVVSAVACGLILAVLVRRPTNGRITRILAGAGTVSYGLYLWHGVLVTAADAHPSLVPLHQPGVLGFVVHLALLLGGSLALAIASWRLLEKPIIDWARGSSVNRLRGRHQPNGEGDVSVAASLGSLPPPAVALGLNQSTSQLGQPL